MTLAPADAVSAFDLINKVEGSAVSNRIGMKFDRIVLQFNVTLIGWQPLHAEKCCHVVNEHEALDVSMQLCLPVPNL